MRKIGDTDEAPLAKIGLWHLSLIRRGAGDPAPTIKDDGVQKSAQIRAA